MLEPMKHVGLLPIEYRVEQLMLGHMFNIINGNAPTYLISGINMNQHRYSTRARELSCVIPRVKSSGLTSFLYQGVCHWNNLPLEIKQCPSKATFKYQVKCILYSRFICAGNQSICTFLILTIGCFLHILSDDCNKYYVPCYFQ